MSDFSKALERMTEEINLEAVKRSGRQMIAAPEMKVSHESKDDGHTCLVILAGDLQQYYGELDLALILD